MNFEECKALLEKEGQAHVLKFWDRLSEGERTALLGQVASIDFAGVSRMKGLLAAASGSAANVEPQPAPVVAPTETESREAIARGEEELKAGRVAAVLVAGGQGSRLGFNGPKGAYLIGPVSNKPLFFFHARKLLALKRKYGKPVPFYIMTSETNDDATRECFRENGFFCLAENDVFFFKQGMWPALDPDGKVILDAPGHIFMSPNGHGGTLNALRSSGAFDDMARRGITTVFYFQVDNPMVDVAAPEFIGLHLLHNADISVKVCAKRDAMEGLGNVVLLDGKFAMVEYTELTDEQKKSTLPNGDLRFKYGSVAIHVFSREFMEREESANLQLHIAHKKIATCDDAGNVIKPTAPNGYKFERFIFDVLPDAGTVLNVAFDRADEFSPVKNAEGSDSPATCRADLMAKWRRWCDCAGIAVPADAAIEIDPAFANNPEELRGRADEARAAIADGCCHLQCK